MNYSYAVDGTSLVENDGPCKRVAIEDERRADLRGHDRDIAWQEGQYHTANKRRTGVDLPLVMGLRDRNSDNTVTHEDGNEGHRQENIQRVKALFVPGQHVLTRHAPHVGDQAIDVEVIPGIGGYLDKGVYLAVCHAAFPFWRETPAQSFSDTFNTESETLEITVAGDVPIPNATITFEANAQPVTNPRVELSTGRFVQYTDTIAAGESVEIDVRNCTATHSTDGTVDRALSRGFADTLVLPRGTYNVDVTCDAGTLDYDVTIEFWNLRET